MGKLTSGERADFIHLGLRKTRDTIRAGIGSCLTLEMSDIVMLMD